MPDLTRNVTENGTTYKEEYTRDTKVEVTAITTIKTKIYNEIDDMSDMVDADMKTLTDDIYNKLDADGHLA